MWKKASKLLANAESIVDAPGSANAKLVATSGGGRPYFVQIGRSGRLSCDCEGFGEKGGVCSHTIAVVEITGNLRQHISTYQKGQQLNITRVGKKGMPKFPGKKPGERIRSRKRRRLATPTRSPSPPPKKMAGTGTSDIYTVKFLYGTMIRSCYGCQTALRPYPDIFPPPDDLVLRRKEFRCFCDSSGSLKITVDKQFGHYHLRRSCVLAKNKDFCPSMISLDAHDSVGRKLLPEHKDRLAIEFGLKF